jgi:hypothetical protein
MSREIIQSVLRANWEVLEQALPSFRKSLEKCRSLDLATPRSFEVEESLDALTSKFSRLPLHSTLPFPQTLQSAF